jgi:hypothetical protein
VRLNHRLILNVLVGCLVISAMAQTNGTVEKLTEVKSPESWTQAPEGFRDVRFGFTLEQAQAVLGPMKCEAGMAGAQQCHTTDRSKAFRVAGEVINTYYFFDEGKFVGVSLSEGLMASLQQFQPSTYIELSTAFKQKFGPPTFTRTFRSHGIREERGNIFNGGVTRRIPYDYTFESVAWENDQVNTYLVSDEKNRISYGIIETQAWAKKKADAEKSRKTSVTPF